MQRAEDSSSRLAPDPARSGLKPTTAFLFLLLVITAIGALVFLTRPTPAPQPTGTTTATEPSFALTNEEAIARFEDLTQVRLRAYSTHDVSLLSSLYTEDSRVAPVASQELRRLAREGVSDVSTYATQHVQVISNTPSEVRLEEQVRINPRFLDEQGKEVTGQTKLVARTIVWTLHLQGSEWLIYDALITKSQVLK